MIENLRHQQAIEAIGRINRKYYTTRRIRKLCGQIVEPNVIPARLAEKLFQLSCRYEDTPVYALAVVHETLASIENGLAEKKETTSQAWSTLLGTAIALSLGHPQQQHVEWPKTLESIAFFAHFKHPGVSPEYGLKLARLWKLEIGIMRPDLATQLDRMITGCSVMPVAQTEQRLWAAVLPEFSRMAAPASASKPLQFP